MSTCGCKIQYPFEALLVLPDAINKAQKLALERIETAYR